MAGREGGVGGGGGGGGGGRGGVGGGGGRLLGTRQYYSLYKQKACYKRKNILFG